MSTPRRTARSPATTGEKQVRGDIATRFKPGQSGNPAGRKRGSRNRLSESFVSALAADFDTYGPAIIAEVRQQKPEAYLRIVASLVPKQLEIGPENPFSDLSDTELDQLLEHMQAKLARLRAP